MKREKMIGEMGRQRLKGVAWVGRRVQKKLRHVLRIERTRSLIAERGLHIGEEVRGEGNFVNM